MDTRLAATRAGDRTGADAHLAEVKQTADRIGVDRNDYRLCFGPTNVHIWLVGLAVEMSDGTEAITRAERFTLPRSAPRERVGHHWIDLARGYLLHGDHQRALAPSTKPAGPRHSRPVTTLRSTKPSAPSPGPTSAAPTPSPTSSAGLASPPKTSTTSAAESVNLDEALVRAYY